MSTWRIRLGLHVNNCLHIKKHLFTITRFIGNTTGVFKFFGEEIQAITTKMVTKIYSVITKSHIDNTWSALHEQDIITRAHINVHTFTVPIKT